MARHAAEWKALTPLAKKFAGPQSDDKIVRFEFGTNRKLPVSYGLHAVNTSGKMLTNVTLAVTSAISSTLPADARTYYVFLREWKDDESVGLHLALVDVFRLRRAPALVDSLPRIGPPPTKGCLTYSLWADQLSQEAVVLDIGCPEAAVG